MAITRHLFLLFTLLLFTGLSINTYAGPVIVPDVVDTPEADARTTIEEAGLTVGNVSNENSETIVAGNVISQDPAAGTEVEAESAVDLVVSDGPAPVIVPDVVDLSLADATTTLNAAGLDLGNTSEQSDETVPEGDVISQDPAAGTEVAAGSEVDLVISSGPAPVTVPSVTGLNLADATSALEADDLVVGNTSEQSDETVPEGDVISQDPAAGTEVEAGSAVDLVISTGPATVPATVPNVVDDSLAVATGKIEAADLVVGNTSEQSSETVPEGDVISQDPVGGTEVEAGSAVDLVISSGPSGGDNITIDGCDTGVPLGEEIQANIDQCEANATNHGQFVRCVAIFTKADGVPQSDRKGIMKCAAHSSIDGSEPTALSEGGNVPDNNTGTPAPSSFAATIQNVTIDGTDTGVGDSDGSIQASVDACAASATSHRKFVKCVGKVAKSLKRSGDITKREKKRMKKAAKKSSIG